MLGGYREQGVLELEQRGFGAQEYFAQGQSVHRLAEVVAAAGEVQVAGGVPGGARDEVLDVEEQVLELPGVGRGPDLLLVEAGHRLHQGVGVVLGDQALFGEHDRVRPVGRQHGR